MSSKQVAATVWSGFTLDLIGSTRVGTAIRKAHGDQSDRDYVLQTRSRVTAQEWKEFARALAKDQRFREVSEGKKAMKLRDAKLQLEWEVVPARGHFSFELVTFPSVDGATSTEERNRSRLEYFERYPGAKNAVKVLKRLCPQLKGNMVEALAFRQGKDLLRNDSSFAENDGSGFFLFQQLITLFDSYPWDPYPNSPLAILRRDAAKYDKEDIQGSLDSAAQIAKHLRKRTTEQREQVTNSWQFMACLMGLGGIMVAFVLTLLVHRALWLALLPKAFEVQALQPQKYVCPDNSCLCSDLRDSSYVCLSWGNFSSFDCALAGVSLNRCRITFLAAAGNLCAHCWILQRAVRVARLSKHADVLAASLCACSTSVLAILFHLRFLGLGDYIVISRLAGNMQHALCMAMSAVVLMSVWEAEDKDPRLTQFRSCGCVFFWAFLPTVLTVEIATAMCMVFWQGADKTEFISQNHVFYTLSLVFQLLCAWGTWSFARSMLKAKAGMALCVQICWLLVDFWYWAGPSLWPVLQQKYNLFMILSCRILLALKLLGVLHLAQRVHSRFGALKAE